MSHDNSEKIRACKGVFNKRLSAEGRYAEYRTLCERLVIEQGITKEQAWRRAARKFYPFGGGAHEFHFLDLENGDTEVEPADGKFAPKGAHGRLRVKLEGSNEDKLIADLIEDIDPTKNATFIASADWVFNNMLTDWRKIIAADVPSIGAFGLLRWARRDDKNEAAFYQMHLKLAEKKSLAEEEARRRDDGRKLLPLMDEFLASLDAPQGEAAVVAE
jgi:hypothetical protein